MQKLITGFIKKCYRNTANLATTVTWFMRNTIHGKWKNYIEKTNSSNKLLILANGPSLKGIINTIPLKKGYDIRVVNDFCRSPVFFSLRPASYVLADPLFFNDTPRAREVFSLLSKVDWDLNLYVPYSQRKTILQKITNPKIRIIPYHCTPYDGWNSVRNFLFRKGYTMPRAQNVAIPSIFIGINEGYTTIELYGVDHSWTLELRVNEENQVCMTDSHFYDQSRVAFKPFLKSDGSEYQLAELLMDFAWMYDGYYKLKEYADSVGCRIVNKTPGSFIDAFERETDTDNIC